MKQSAVQTSKDMAVENKKPLKIEVSTNNLVAESHLVFRSIQKLEIG